MIRSTLTAVIVALFAVEATAEVTRVDVAKRADVGASGYEKIIGTIHFAIDPKDPGNQAIVGLDKAPRNPSGKVEFAADLYILQPRDASRGNGVALVDVVNRGRKMTLNGYSRGGTLDPATEADLGDGFLTRLGYTLVWVGWQFDVQRGNNLIGIDVPRAAGVTVTARAEFTPNDRNPDVTVADLVGYPIVGDGSDASLTVRDGPFGEPQDIPQDRFRLEGNGRGDGPAASSPGRTYQLSYRTQNPAIARRRPGCVPRHGVVARSATPSAPSHPRYSDRLRVVAERTVPSHVPVSRVQHATSAAARCSTACSRTSQGRRAPEPQRERARRRTASACTPRRRSRSRMTVQRDPAAGKTDGLLEKALRARACAEGLLHEQLASSTWGGGRSAALDPYELLDPDHFDPDVARQRARLPVRGHTAFPGRVSATARAAAAAAGWMNPVQYWWPMRALLVAMTQWVTSDAGGPPPSRYPRSGALGRNAVKRSTEAFFFGGLPDSFPAPPGVQSPRHPGIPGDVVAARSTGRCLVSQGRRRTATSSLASGCRDVVRPACHLHGLELPERRQLAAHR